MCNTVSLKKVIEKLKLENLTPEIDIESITINEPEVNRPALQLTGFFEEFDNQRIQIIGNVEHSYLESLAEDERAARFERMIQYKIPCLVLCRGFEAEPWLVELALNYQVPILRTMKTTSSFMAEVIRWLNVELAPSMTVHGVLVDVYGEGILITGESGIGKSEAALELIKRGHRLVSDDVVEIKKVSDDTLIGMSPDITRHFIELRGIGIIDVKTLFGVESVKNTQQIDLVINLEDWKKDKEYDRMGLEDNYVEYLGNKVVVHNIPIRPGRNLAIICESAAVNWRQKKMGYNAAQEMYKRFTSQFEKKG